MLSMTGYSSVGSKKQAQVHMNFLAQLAGQLGREIAMFAVKWLYLGGGGWGVCWERPCNIIGTTFFLGGKRTDSVCVCF